MTLPDDKTLLTKLSEDMTIGESHKDESLVLREVSKCKIKIESSLLHLSLENCNNVILEINCSPSSGIVTISDSVGCEVNVNSSLRLVRVSQSSGTELHYHESSFFGEVHTITSKGTIVCLPDACNMIPANKDESILVSLLTADGAIKSSVLPVA